MRRTEKVMKKAAKTKLKTSDLKDTLPKKPSALILLALDDVRRAEKAGYVINMGTWHTPMDQESLALMLGPEEKPNKKQQIKSCAVCFAGSVMACALNLDHTVNGDAFDGVPSSLQAKMYALNAFREGSIKTGLEHMGLAIPAVLVDNMEVPDYEDDKKGFRRHMMIMADALERFGL